jgi:hypothetical protein
MLARMKEHFHSRSFREKIRFVDAIGELKVLKIQLAGLPNTVVETKVVLLSRMLVQGHAHLRLDES